MLEKNLYDFYEGDQQYTVEERICSCRYFKKKLEKSGVILQHIAPVSYDI